MKTDIKLGSIPGDKYEEYKYDVIFNAYKWDPQVGEINTVAQHAVLISKNLASQLEFWAQKLAEETILLEKALMNRLQLVKKLGISKKIINKLHLLAKCDLDKHVRLMRFDFHPTSNGWSVSEVNSDVPAGFAEGSILPKIAVKYFEGYTPGISISDIILEAFKEKLNIGSQVAFIHATSYSEDRQVMQSLGDLFENSGYRALYAAPDNIIWNDGKPKGVDAIIRAFPLEWLAYLPKSTGWHNYFGCSVPSCNPPTALLTQSKRLPLLWDELEIDTPIWRSLLPPTVDPKLINKNDNGWILKPAMGRVGEGISIKGAASEKEKTQIEKAAKKRHKEWAAQKQFLSEPLITDEGKAYHLCLGVFTVQGRAAGFYGRVSLYPHIDNSAIDIPVLVEGE